MLTGIFVLVLVLVLLLVLVLVLGPTASITGTSTISLSTRTNEPTHRWIGCRSILRSRDHILALITENLKGFVENRSKLGEDRATTNSTTFVMLDLRLWNANPIQFPIDVLPA